VPSEGKGCGKNYSRFRKGKRSSKKIGEKKKGNRSRLPHKAEARGGKGLKREEACPGMIRQKGGESLKMGGTCEKTTRKNSKVRKQITDNRGKNVR